MDRRTFMKLLGGLASMPIVGKLAKPLKSETVQEGIAAVSDKGMQLYEMVISKVMKEGKKVGESGRVDSYKHPDRPDITVDVNQTDGSAEIYFDTDQGSKGFAEIRRDPESGGDELIEAEEVYKFFGKDGEDYVKDVEEGISGGITNLEEFTRIKKNIGGNVQPYDARASVADFARAIDKVGAGTDMQKAMAIQDYGQNVQRQNMRGMGKTGFQTQTPFFSGPAFNKYSAERTRAYTESPSRLQYNLDANKAAGQFIQDKSKEMFGDNIFGKSVGILGTAASVPLAAAITPFHEAAQVVAEGRMKPVSEYSGDVANFTRAFLAEKPLLTAAQRAGGVLQSIPVVGDAVTKAGEGIYDAVQSGKDSTGLEDYLEGTKAATSTSDGDDPLAAERARLIKEGIDPMSVGLIGGTGDTNRPTMADVAGPATQSIIPGFSVITEGDKKLYVGPDGQIYGPETYASIAAGRYPNIFDPNKQSLKDGGSVDLTIITMPDISGSGVESLFKTR